MEENKILIKLNEPIKVNICVFTLVCYMGYKNKKTVF